MENDDLFDHVKSHRQEFEAYEFEQDASWDQIAQKLDDREKSHVKIPVKYVWRVAAVLVISLGATFYMAWNGLSRSSFDVAISSELAEADAYYGSLISTKVLQIKSGSSEIDPELFQDIDALDQAFSELKEDLKDNADSEEVVNAMILNYKIKLEILEKIYQEIEDQNKQSDRKQLENEG